MLYSDLLQAGSLNDELLAALGSQHRSLLVVGTGGRTVFMSSKSEFAQTHQCLTHLHITLRSFKSALA